MRGKLLQDGTPIRDVFRQGNVFRGLHAWDNTVQPCQTAEPALPGLEHRKENTAQFGFGGYGVERKLRLVGPVPIPFRWAMLACLVIDDDQCAVIQAIEAVEKV